MWHNIYIGGGDLDYPLYKGSTKMSALTTAIAICLHLLEEGDSFTISEDFSDGKKKLVLVTQTDFEAVANGQSLEDILNSDVELERVAHLLSKRCTPQ